MNINALWAIKSFENGLTRIGISNIQHPTSNKVLILLGLTNLILFKARQLKVLSIFPIIPISSKMKILLNSSLELF